MGFNKRHKLTLLDLGGVVFQSTGLSNDKIDWGIISALNHKYGHALNVGEDQFPAFLTEYNKLSKQSLTGAAFLKEVFDTLEINKELIDIIRVESEIVIVSDNYRENIAYISQRYNFASWSLKQIYSFDYEMEKANPDFFKRLLKDLDGYQVEEMIYIDDSAHKLASAAQYGIKGILYQDNEQVRAALRALKGG
ncbi:MAG: HAD hydrolase-like protein [Bacteroidota bacterium]